MQTKPPRVVPGRFGGYNSPMKTFSRLLAVLLVLTLILAAAVVCSPSVAAWVGEHSGPGGTLSR